MFNRELLMPPSTEVAPRLLGATLSHTTPEGTVSVRLTEVEAYLGALDPGSHAYRGRTARNAVMFGEPGHLYTYFSYGMHVCANVVCLPEGSASGVLLRAGEVVEGAALARRRRATSKTDADLARGPGRLAAALGITLDDGGADLGAPPFGITWPEGVASFETGPRTGLSGSGGTAEYPWRFWLPGESSVSSYRSSPARPPRPRG